MANKWRTLKYNLQAVRTNGHTTLLPFRGAYFNHLRAPAAAGGYLGFRTIGIVRGEEHLPLNEVLQAANQFGMQFYYLDRTSYRNKHSPKLLQELQQEFGRFYLLPEGGSNIEAVRGCAELPSEITVECDVICCPCGTGGTLAGIATGAPSARALGFAALKGGQFLTEAVANLLPESATNHRNWKVIPDYHFGGYAKSTQTLKKFRAEFALRHDLVLDRVYVAKMMYGIYDLAKNGYFSPGTRIVAVITGSEQHQNGA